MKAHGIVSHVPFAKYSFVPQPTMNSTNMSMKRCAMNMIEMNTPMKGIGSCLATFLPLVEHTLDDVVVAFDGFLDFVIAHFDRI